MRGSDGITLLKQVQSKLLLDELIQQVNKDAGLAGIDQRIAHTSNIEELVKQIHRFLVHLMVHDFGAYVNFLYRVDVPEKELRSIGEIDPVLIAEKVVILVLQREWKKVALRNRIQ